MPVLMGVLLFILLLWLFLRNTPHLTVLMYHKVDPLRQDALTVSTAQLDEQFRWLVQSGYQSVSVSDLLQRLKNRSPLPPKTVLITFDDAYVNNLNYALPILQQHRLRATLFVPTAYIGGCNEWDGCTEPLMSLDQLRSLPAETIEIGLHSHRHQHFARLLTAEIQQDLIENIRVLTENGLPFVPALAYPYGGRPKERGARAAMQKTMSELGIDMAFRIGNRLNRWPIRNRYEIRRLDIRGTDALVQFIRKVHWGKWL